MEQNLGGSIPTPWAKLRQFNPLNPFGIRIDTNEERRASITRVTVTHSPQCECPMCLACPCRPADRVQSREPTPHYEDDQQDQGHFGTETESTWSQMEGEWGSAERDLSADIRRLLQQFADLQGLHQLDVVGREAIFDQIRETIQNIKQQEMTEGILVASQIVDEIRQIVAPGTNQPQMQPQMDIPLDVQDDLTYLSWRWSQGDLSSNPWRGIQASERYKRFEINYPHRRNGNFFGRGHLVNGICWPQRLCMVRDGAHRLLESGICGVKGEGAQAVVLARAPVEDYADIDLGEIIEYVGTAQKEPVVDANNNNNNDQTIYQTMTEAQARANVTPATQLLFDSIRTQNDVRVIRGSKLPKTNPWRPAEGYRFDGCYKVVRAQLLEARRSIYRFQLIRNPGQAPIRVSGH